MFCGVQGKPIYLNLSILLGKQECCNARTRAPGNIFVRHCAPGISVGNQNTFQKNCETVMRRNPLRDTQTSRAYTSSRKYC